MYKKVHIQKTSLETTLEKVISTVSLKKISFSIYTNEFDTSMIRVFFPNNASKLGYLDNSIAFVDKKFDTNILLKHPITIIRNANDEDIEFLKGAEKINKIDDYVIFYAKEYFKDTEKEVNKIIKYESSVFPPAKGVDMSKLQMTTVGKYSITFYKANLDIVNIIKQKVGKDITIMDATACVGGDTIGFAMNFNYVISIEKDPVNYSALVNNIGVYGLNNVTVENKDFDIDGVKIIAHRKPDVVYFDPPWGGSDYYLYKELELYLDTTNIKDLIKVILKHFNFVKMIVLKVPFNFNLNGLDDEMSEVKVHKLKKFNIITITNINKSDF